MGFTLVRTDSDEPFKIKLTVGSHFFGRGKFLDCEDKRVSRNHGELNVTSDSLTIKALHQNPCFFTKKETKDMQILRRDSSIDLGHGDKFGLLPESYWYEILHCDLDISSPTDIPDQNMNLNETNDVTQTCNLSNEINYELNESANERSESPSLLNGRESPSFTQNQCEDRNESFSIIQNTNPNQEAVQASPSTLSTSKRKLSQEEIEIKKIKTEPVEVKQEPPDEAGVAESGVRVQQEIKREPQVKIERDDGPSTSGNQNTKPVTAVNTPVKITTPPVLRERCMYGQSCYRKNQQHLAQFSHPSDADWGSGPQASCPWGSRCRRRDPRHWRDHTHPVNTRPPTTTQGKKRVVRRKTRSESQSDDEEIDVLIVTGKRQRKKINMQDWSDSELEDPFGTDDSDDWDPGSEEENSQSQGFTQDF